MTRSESAVRYRRLRAPQHNGETFFDPPLITARQTLIDNVERRASREHDVGGRSLQEISAAARAFLIEEARAYTTRYRDVDEAPKVKDASIVVTGHQPELYHPGVWIKTFALDQVARDQHAHAIHLLIDNDSTGDCSIRVPTGSIAEPRVESVTLDRNVGDRPYEARAIVDRQVFSSFATRVSKLVAPFVEDPIVNQLWPDAANAANEHDNLGRCIAQARHRLEGRWGLHTLELPFSRVCDHESFRYFVAHILTEVSRFRDVYNMSLAEYRRVNRVRSHTHPVPPLAIDGEWMEAPFWLWPATEPSRRPLFVRPLSDAVEISDRHDITHRLPLRPGQSAAKAVEQLEQLTRNGLRLRPRALLTTMYARVFLCDLFIHGIGGAKYDQLTDAIIERFFGFVPPSFLTATATAKLPIDRTPVGRDDLRHVMQKLRELDFNPQRHVGELAEGQRLSRAKMELVTRPVAPDRRRERHLEIAQLNSQLQPFVESLRKSLRIEQEHLKQRLRHEKTLGSREYSFVLFPEQSLRPFLLDI